MKWNGLSIKQVYKFKYLGVIYDNLSWKTHVGGLQSKIGKRLGILKRIRGSLTVDAANAVYVSFIRPVMEEWDAVWHPCGVGNSMSLEKLQRRAARIVSTKEVMMHYRSLNGLYWRPDGMSIHINW